MGARRELPTLISSVPLTGLAFSCSFLTRNSHVLSIPFFTAIGLAPDVTACNKKNLMISIYSSTKALDLTGTFYLTVSILPATLLSDTVIDIAFGLSILNGSILCISLCV